MQDKKPKGLVAYPSLPREIGEVIKTAIEIIRREHFYRDLTTWEENDIAGRCLVDPILRKIEEGNLLVADITRLNFNVVYEIGFAIGCGKRAFLVRNSALLADDKITQEVGVFDTLGYNSYSNSKELVDLILSCRDYAPIKFDTADINTSAPVYVLLPKTKANAEVRILSRIKKARLQFRSFDPEEQGRLAVREAIENVARSHGIIVPLLPEIHRDSPVHNLRAAFIAGLAGGMDKLILLLQPGDEPIPLDYRDLVSSYKFLEQIDDHIGEFARDVTERFQTTAQPVIPEPKTFLAQLTLGASSAENEMQELGYYYLETDEYQRTLQGDVQVVSGRKGSGKTALFAQLRNKIRQGKQMIVLDLKPEGFQLLKFKEIVLDLLEEGTKVHTITAFWEYLLLLETCHKILEKDRIPHTRDHQLYEPYQALAQSYREDEYVSEGDFAERMLKLMQRIEDDFGNAYGDKREKKLLHSAKLTEILYVHDVAKLRTQVIKYLGYKKGLWILFDNLDKGWPAYGVGRDDLIMLRALLDAIGKVQRDLQKHEINCYGVIFIRNDVYELLVDTTPDRGKIARINLDWTDPDLLRELLRRRFIYTGVKGKPAFEQLWPQICISHIGGEETSQYMIDRCLMRPRSLIDLVRYCRSHAVNLGHGKIQLDDINQGEEGYSTDLLLNIGFEIRDVAPWAEDALYEFIEAPSKLTASQVDDLLSRSVSEPVRRGKILDLLLWYGFLGFVRDDGEVAYIYSVKYDMKRLKALLEKRVKHETIFMVNPAFWKGLEIHN